MTSIHESELHRKEADYHDEWALTTPLDRILVRECFESPAAVDDWWANFTGSGRR